MQHCRRPYAHLSVALRPAVSLVLLLALATGALAQTPSDLVGLWLGEAEHNGQTGQFALEFSEDGAGGLKASLSVVELEAWDVAAAPAELNGDRILIGPWELVLEPDGTISATLPTLFVPVHEIPIVFRRVDRLERSSAPPIEAPTAVPVWERDLGSPVWAGLSVAGDLLFVGDDSGRLSALEPTTGETRWAVETGGPIRARPTVVGETLFVHSDDGDLYALEPGGGSVLWRARISEVSRVPLSEQGSRYNHYASGVAVAEDVVYVGAFDGSLVALDSGTGAELWRFTAADTIAGTPAVADGKVFFGSFDGGVYAVDAASGEQVWRYETGAAVVSSPLVRDGLVVIGSRSYDLLALDAGSGEPTWKVYYWFSWVESSATERDGVAYVGASDSQLLHAVDLATGEVRWRFDTRGSAWSQPAVTEDLVFIGTVGVADYWANHSSAFLAVDRRSGEAVLHYPQTRPGEAALWGFAAAPVVDATLVFAADTSGRVYAFRQP